MPKTKKTVKTNKPATKTKAKTKVVKTKKVVKPATKTKKTVKPAVKAVKPASSKRGPGRPKGSKNKPKVVVAPVVSAPEPANDRLSSCFDHNGEAEPASTPQPPKYTLAKPVVENASVVLAEPERGLVQKIDPITLPKAKPVSDNGIVVMQTSAKDVPAPDFVKEVGSVKNEEGCLIVQGPARKDA